MKNEKNIQTAIFTNKPSKERISGFDRVYLGEEFCSRLLPDLKSLIDNIKIVKENNKQLSLVFPPLEEIHIGYVKEILKKVYDIIPEAEIIFNDWAILNMIKDYSSFKLSIGRLISGQQISTRYKKENIIDADLKLFLDEHNIQRIEVNNYPGKINEFDNVFNTKFKGSLNYPFTYITSTYYCSIAGLAPQNKTMQCKKDCRDYIFELEYPKEIIKEYESVLIRGKTRFVRVENKDNLKQEWIDRIVYNEELLKMGKNDSKLS